MATTQQSTGKRTTKSKSASAKKTTTTRKTAQKDAVALLKADHREVEGWFSQFEKAANEGKKLELAEKICLALKVHTQIEEELVYPASREYVEEDMVDEAIVEHDAAKKLIAEIEGMEPSDEMYEAKVKVLSEMIQHHVQEEEKEYFPQLQKSEMDLKGIGEQITMRREELMAQMEPAAPKRMQ